ncbi:MAG TPA: transcriptional repressor [Dehalococcoidia bacterium]|nr:transcriptional repressor [Dehalococcoidia bacterium]
MRRKSDSRQILNSAQQRITSQRVLLLDLIRQGDGHLAADELYRRARQKLPRISLSTVYRALQLFKRLGLVQEHHFEEGHLHYEARPAGDHHHLLCLGCGHIVEFRCPLSQQLRQEVARETGFQITGAEVRMEGYCARCRQKDME